VSHGELTRKARNRVAAAVSKDHCGMLKRLGTRLAPLYNQDIRGPSGVQLKSSTAIFSEEYDSNLLCTDKPTRMPLGRVPGERRSPASCAAPAPGMPTRTGLATRNSQRTRGRAPGTDPRDAGPCAAGMAMTTSGCIFRSARGRPAGDLQVPPGSSAG
jgi:hypothetical protein